MATRNYPRDSLQQALVVAQKITDENAAAPMKRLLVADALGLSPSSSNFRYLLSSSRTYGLTEGTEKAIDVSITELGKKVARSSGVERMVALRQAVMTPDLFKDFFERFNGNKLPSAEMLKKILVTDFHVPADRSEEAADLITENGTFTGLIRQISGAPHVLIDAPGSSPAEETPEPSPPVVDDLGQQGGPRLQEALEVPAPPARPPSEGKPPKAIFIGHGRKTGPLEKLQKVLAGFQIPYKVAVSEPNLGRPIPQKVKDVMLQCGSAILIFTKDQKFMDEDGKELWRPSENVVHELGAASYAYEDRVVIFKENGITLPSNFSSVGYIEFEENAIEAKTAELLQELIGFGLVRITPTG